MNKKRLIPVIIAVFIINIIIISLFSSASAASCRRGSTGSTVREIQTRLKNWGYYSGTVTYRNGFSLKKKQLKDVSAWEIDLGLVKNLARVKVNGHDLGVVWKAPFRVEVPAEYLHDGRFPRRSPELYIRRAPSPALRTGSFTSPFPTRPTAPPATR